MSGVGDGGVAGDGDRGGVGVVRRARIFSESPLPM
jgi:hypothetical protein